MQDQITRELEQIIWNRIESDGPDPCESPDCNCSLCCAQRALALRKAELKRQTTIIGAINYEVKTEMTV